MSLAEFVAATGHEFRELTATRPGAMQRSDDPGDESSNGEHGATHLSFAPLTFSLQCTNFPTSSKPWPSITPN